jgi:hypothetical protein
MGKLHELLAAEPDVKAAAQRALSQVMGRFKSGQSKFVGHIKTYRPLDEEGDTFPDEEQVIATSVHNELDEIRREYGKWIDLAVEKEVTNTTTDANLDFGKEAFALPATALLNLEGKLTKLREVYAAIPTNDPSRRWGWNENTGQYETPPTVNYRTEKVPEALMGSEATEDHPAQIQWFTKDVRVGEWEQTLFSQMIPPATKRAMLRRLDQLIVLVKKARQRANTAETMPVKIADKLFDYIQQDV